jgi:hypothetical protein
LDEKLRDKCGNDKGEGSEGGKIGSCVAVVLVAFVAVEDLQEDAALVLAVVVIANALLATSSVELALLAVWWEEK